MKLLLCALCLVLICRNCVKSDANCHVNSGARLECWSIDKISSTTLSDIIGSGSFKTIDIKNNFSELHIQSSGFQSMTSLETLYISDSNIKRLYADTFKDLPLVRLHLTYSSITKIFPGTFVNLPKLKFLWLSHNSLKVIEKNVISNLPIQDLTLSSNQLSSIEPNTFENLPNLKKLKLDQNKIETIYIHTILSYPEKLEILWLHINSIITVSNYMLQGLSNLKLLNLGFNKINFIEPLSFQQTEKLETLVLTNNHLKQVDGQIFPRTGHNSLTKLYLDNNKLMYLSSSFVSRLNTLKKITLIGNPWLCPCLNDLQRILVDNGVEEKCAGDYTSGKRPVCVSEKVGGKGCIYKYNEELREIYETYKKENPLYKRVIDCLL